MMEEGDWMINRGLKVKTVLIKDGKQKGEGANDGVPGSILQLPIKGGASWDSCLVLLEDLLALQAVRALRGRASGKRRSSSSGHPVPGGVPPEGRLVLAGCTLAVDLVLHHGYAVQLGAAPERPRGKFKVSHEDAVGRLQKLPGCIAGYNSQFSFKSQHIFLSNVVSFKSLSCLCIHQRFANVVAFMLGIVKWVHVFSVTQFSLWINQPFISAE